MEIKIVADKKLLEALDKLAAALAAVAPAEPTPNTAEPALNVAEPTPNTAEPTPTPAKQVDRSEVQHVAIAKIQAGLRDKIKELLLRYGVSRLSDLPEDKLAEFLQELEALHG